MKNHKEQNCNVVCSKYYLLKQFTMSNKCMHALSIYLHIYLHIYIYSGHPRLLFKAQSGLMQLILESRLLSFLVFWHTEFIGLTKCYQNVTKMLPKCYQNVDKMQIKFFENYSTSNFWINPMVSFYHASATGPDVPTSSKVF